MDFKKPKLPLPGDVTVKSILVSLMDSTKSLRVLLPSKVDCELDGMSGVKRLKGKLMPVEDGIVTLELNSILNWVSLSTFLHEKKVRRMRGSKYFMLNVLGKDREKRGKAKRWRC